VSWTLNKRKMWYKLTGQPVWKHTSCINKKSELPLFLEPSWVVGWECPVCKIKTDQEDFFQRKPIKDYILAELDPENFG